MRPDTAAHIRCFTLLAAISRIFTRLAATGFCPASAGPLVWRCANGGIRLRAQACDWEPAVSAQAMISPFHCPLAKVWSIMNSAQNVRVDLSISFSVRYRIYRSVDLARIVQTGSKASLNGYLRLLVVSDRPWRPKLVLRNSNMPRTDGNGDES